VDDRAEKARSDEAVAPSSAAVSFITTEHFTLQGARAATISESIGRASMFLGSVSAGLIALGLFATATHLGTAFNAFGLVLLPTLALLGLVTVERVLQSGIEDFGYAQRIARLRAYYFETAPELTPYLLSVERKRRLNVLGIWGGWTQGFRTVAGSVAVITSVLAGSSVGLLVAVAGGGSLGVSFGAGGAVTVVVEFALASWMHRIWDKAQRSQLTDA
jgi:hypothetical protein